jgi:Vitamin K-dependent gamma-carboxylase
MRHRTESFGTRVHRFFFDEEVPYGLALCRIVLPIVLMGMVLPRWAAVREIYSTDGATAPLAVGYGYFDFLPEFSGSVAVGLYSLMVLAFMSASIGWNTRASLIIANVLFTYFCMLDCVSTMTKYTVIATHMLFLLALSGCGSLWSVDAWLAGRKRSYWPSEPSLIRTRFPAWPRRLMQLHIGSVYFGAAITKMHTPTFFTGDQLQYWMQTHLNFQHPLGELLSLYPLLLVVMAYVAIVWEVVFIFLSWKSMWRMFVLPMGVLFHFMTMLTLGLLMFPMVCFTAYLSFIDEDDFQTCAAWYRRQVRSQPWLNAFAAKLTTVRERLGDPVGWRTSSRAAFVFALAIFSVTNIELEIWRDPFGLRRPEGPHSLTTVDSELIQKILSPTEPQREADMFFAIDTGTIMVGEQLANRRREFRQGETMIAQCNLTPPHDDLFIGCQIHDSEHRIVNRLETVATREMFRANFTCPITDTMTPGDYTLVITTGGRPVMQKFITVLPAHGAASAN